MSHPRFQPQTTSAAVAAPAAPATLFDSFCLLFPTSTLLTSGRITASLTAAQSPRPSLALPNSAAERIHKDTDWRITPPLFPPSLCAIVICASALECDSVDRHTGLMDRCNDSVPNPRRRIFICLPLTPLCWDDFASVQVIRCVEHLHTTVPFMVHILVLVLFTLLDENRSLLSHSVHHLQRCSCVRSWQNMKTRFRS